jgi:anti-sigma regulatory factor (Ser/Thr protein kinase)
MAVETAGTAVGSGEHIVHFYEHDSELYATVGRYLADAARAGDVAIVIATEAHRLGFEAQLEAGGIDPAQALSSGTFVSLDATATMARFMPGGRIDGDAFHRVIGGVVAEAAETGRPIRAYGEMVALLWDAGDVLGAIELEELWNDLGREFQFSLLCAYPSESVSGPEHVDSLQRVCHLHSSVLPAARHDELHARNRPSPATEVAGQFPAEIDAPRAARHLVSQALRDWGHDDTLLYDVQLVVTELATNVVAHARSPFSVAARMDDSGVRVSVQDASPLRPTMRDGGPTASSGRGLRLVAALASNWGVEVTADGKTVWAELRPRPPLVARA